MPDHPKHFPTAEELCELDRLRVLARLDKDASRAAYLEALAAIAHKLILTAFDARAMWEERQQPRCNECGVVLGDNWCGACAGKASDYRAAKALAELEGMRIAFRRLDALYSEDQDFGDPPMSTPSWVLAAREGRGVDAARYLSVEEKT